MTMTEPPAPTPESPPKRKVGRPPGGKGAIRYVDYTCMCCNQLKAREELTTKRAVFYAMGRAGRMVRSRTIGFICSVCLEQDPHWTRRSRVDSPGMKGTRLAEPE